MGNDSQAARSTASFILVSLMTFKTVSAGSRSGTCSIVRNNSKKLDAYRFLHTESSFLMSEAAHVGYEEDGVPKYKILAMLDSKTCNICGELDNKAYEVGKEVAGVNMPPFYPLCRCTMVPHYDDIPTEGSTRAARDPETGKTYEVPVDMS